MKRMICSTHELVENIERGFFSEDTAFISFHNSSDELAPADEKFIFPKEFEFVFYVDVPDVSLDAWRHNGKDDRDFIGNADQLATFICEAVRRDQLIVCHCNDGRGRSAACAAAIDQQFEKNGITVFEMDRYKPNKAIYRKILESLDRKFWEVHKQEEYDRLEKITQNVNEYITIDNHPECFLATEIEEMIPVIKARIEVNIIRVLSYLKGQKSLTRLDVYDFKNFDAEDKHKVIDAKAVDKLWEVEEHYIGYTTAAYECDDPPLEVYMMLVKIEEELKALMQTLR